MSEKNVYQDGSMRLEISERAPDRRGLATRIFVWPKGESVVDNLINRTSRPEGLWREKVLPVVYEYLGLPKDTKAKWDAYAGCSMCPCSPGFKVWGHKGREIHVDVTGLAEYVDGPERENRAAQLAS